MHIGNQIIEVNKNEIMDEEMKDETKSKDQQEYNWYFIDEEEDFETLLESLNPKGIHEKKLIENLKKIRY